MVSVEGICTAVSAEQPLKVHSEMAVKPAGKEMEVRAEQFWNAHPPMLATVDGMVADVSELHPLNAHQRGQA